MTQDAVPGRAGTPHGGGRQQGEDRRGIAVAGSAGLAWRALGVVLLLWLVSPVIAPAHLEGFSLEIERLALLKSRGLLSVAADGYPYIVSYYYSTRFGAIDLLSLLMRTGLDPTAAFQLLVRLGWVAFFGAGVACVRRWTGNGWLVSAIATALVASTAANGAFLNDNVVAAAFSAGALFTLACWPGQGWGRAAPLVAGVLAGLAVVCRLDAMLMAPAYAFALWRREGRLPAFLAQGALAGVAGVAAALAWTRANGLDLADMAAIAAKYRTNWDATPLLPRDILRETVHFAGPLGWLLIGTGVFAAWRGKQKGLLLFLIAPMILYYVAVVGTLRQARILIYLTPFAAALAAIGLAWMWQVARGEPQRYRVAARAAALAALFLFLVPVPRWGWSDGPRAVGGAFWNPPAWWLFQRDIGRAQAFQRARILADARSGRTIVSDDWDTDRLAELALTQAGSPLGAAPAPAACRQMSSWFRIGGRPVVHVRAATPFSTNYIMRFMHLHTAERTIPCALAQGGERFDWLAALNGFRSRSHPYSLLGRMRAPPLPGSVPTGRAIEATPPFTLVLPPPVPAWTFAVPMSRRRLVALGVLARRQVALEQRYMKPEATLPGTHPRELSLRSYDAFYVHPALPEASY